MKRFLSVLILIAVLLAFGTATAAVPPPCVDVETTSAKDLAAKLDGVGEAKAKAIITYRATHRTANTKAGKKKWNFNNWATLMKVPGIGHAICTKNIAKVCFSGKVQKACPAAKAKKTK